MNKADDSDFIIVKGQEDGQTFSTYYKIVVNQYWALDSIRQNVLLSWYDYCEWAPDVESLMNMKEEDWEDWVCDLVRKELDSKGYSFGAGIIACLKKVSKDIILIYSTTEN